MSADKTFKKKNRAFISKKKQKTVVFEAFTISKVAVGNGIEITPFPVT